MEHAEARPTFDQVETRVRDLCRSQGLPQPDELIEADDADEVLALWHDRKVALVIALDE